MREGAGMKAIIFQAETTETCHPVTLSRSLGECPIANRPLAQIQRERLLEAGFKIAETGNGHDLFVRQDAWLSTAMLTQLAHSKNPLAVRDAQGTLLAWIGNSAQKVIGTKTLPLDDSSFLIRYPWDLLTIQEQVLGSFTETQIEGELSPSATHEGTLILGKGSRVLPGVYIEGTVIIGANCKIGPNCYLRGSTSIGDRCHIGQAVEIKNSIIMESTNIGHLSYCGDSVIGCHVNFGAGTIVANFRHDGENHRSLVDGKLIDTGRHKFGAVIGDHVHTGIHTSIYPGRKIWPHICTRPGDIVKTDLMGQA